MLSLRDFSEAAAPANPWLESSDRASALTQATEEQHVRVLAQTHTSDIGERDITFRVASCNRTCKWNYNQKPGNYRKPVSMYSKSITTLSIKIKLNKKKKSKETDYKVFLFHQTVERSWNATMYTLQALSMREAGNIVKMLRKQSVLWYGERRCIIRSTSTRAIPQWNTVHRPYTSNCRLLHQYLNFSMLRREKQPKHRTVWTSTFIGDVLAQY